MNKFKKAWEQLESLSPRPKYSKAVVAVNYDEFASNVEKQQDDFVKKITESLYNGDIYITKNAFSKEFLENLRKKVFKIISKTEPSFHKCVEGSPNFHRKIDDKIAKNYSFEQVRSIFYWYKWNNDLTQETLEINKRWQVLKLLSGLEKNIYEKNTPKDGIVERFQVANYVAGTGRCATHSDPYKNCKFVLNAYMSKRGIHFNKGGFYVLGKNKEPIDVEKDIDIGDMGFHYASVWHGVSKINPDKKKVDWDAEDGRWWVNVCAIDSNMVSSRTTAAVPEKDQY